MNLQSALQTLKDIAPFVAAFSATMAWIAKLRWAKEFKEAKEAQIKALEAQVKTKEEIKEAAAQNFHAQLKAQKADYEAQLRIKEAEMAGLAEKLNFWENISSEQVREYIDYTKQQLETYNNELKDALQDKEDLITILQKQNDSLTADHQTTIARIEELKSEKELLKIKIKEIKEEQTNVEAVEKELKLKVSDKVGAMGGSAATVTSVSRNILTTAVTMTSKQILMAGLPLLVANFLYRK